LLRVTLWYDTGTTASRLPDAPSASRLRIHAGNNQLKRLQF
jgi:nucleoid-associated protein YgaU